MCDTIAIVEKDRVFFAKNSDRDINEAQILEWHPRRAHAEGASLQCTWITIPQVRETHAVLLSRPYWMWGAEMGANEFGVTIGNEAVFTKAGYAKSGLLGMDLLRLALERSTTAEEAVNIITALLQEHGQGGGCSHENRSFSYHNSFIVADPTQAYVLETAGKETATEMIQGVRTISNGLTISGFAERHSNRLYTYFAAAHERQCRTTLLARENRSLMGLMGTLRDHGGPAWPHYRLSNGAMGGPCVHAGGLLAASQTTASWVAELRPGNHAHWVTATAAPCTSLFKPVSVLHPVDLGPSPEDKADDSLWWTHERFHRAAMGFPEQAGAFLGRERDPLERLWMNNTPTTEEAFAAHRSMLKRWSKQIFMGTDHRPAFVRRYWNKRNTRAGLLL
ncbi:MAG: peptidase U34 [Candidatus Hydrogenedentes bacterium]|nr:peptidase U34 [Candidatus Hydrogenedentota bacterium]